jgi:hypothetical protein
MKHISLRQKAKVVKYISEFILLIKKKLMQLLKQPNRLCLINRNGGLFMTWYLIAIFSLVSLCSFAQVSLKDSTIQVIGYWKKNERQHYLIRNEKVEFNTYDTLSRRIIEYEVDVTILDSTTHTYTIEWDYKHIVIDSTHWKLSKRTSVNMQDILILQIINNRLKAVVETNEVGKFIALKNWQDISNNIKQTANELRHKYSYIKDINLIIKQIEDNYSKKANVESMIFRDIQQFYNFHGSQYKTKELLQGEVKMPSSLNYNQDPISYQYNIQVEEVNSQEKYYTITSRQFANSEQLANQTYQQLVTLAKKSGTPIPKQDAIKSLKNETAITSSIHNTGWVLYSIQNNTLTTDKTTTVEEQIIEIRE